jgi:hypothetical protein
VIKNLTSQLRRPLMLAAASGVAVAGLTTAIVPAALAVPAVPAHPPRPTTIRLVADQVTQDMISTANIESDRDETAAGKVIGADGFVCLLPGHKPGSCAAVINLTAGALFFSGKASKTGASGKIVDGTGKYAGAAGTAVATSKSASKTLIVIRLRKL